MIKTVATTVADAVRLAVRENAPDYWRNRLEDGPYKTGIIHNQIYSADWQTTENESRAMEYRVRYGRAA